VRAQSRFNGQRAMKAAHAMRRDSRHTRRLADPRHPFPRPVAIVVPAERAAA